MSDFKWYIIHVAAGSENKVAADLSAQFVKNGIGELIEDVLVLKKVVNGARKGVKTQEEERILPGYVFIRMVCNPDTLDTIRRTPRVIGMLGADLRSDPKPLSDAEVENLLSQVGDAASTHVPRMSFEPGEIIRVTEGLFASMEGVVDEVDATRMRIKVSIPILGRPTSVDLDFAHIEKI
jgi:transcriptional antiterminator NusG